MLLPIAVAIGAAGLKLATSRRRNFGRTDSEAPPDLDSFSPVVLEWNNLKSELKLKKGKGDRTILQGVSGKANPGRLLAIMGASGSGKTSLLNMLSGRTPDTKGLRLSGRIRINGLRLRQSKHKQAYIRQEDVFYSQLTARETLMMEAKLRLPKSVPDSSKEMLVEELISRLSLKACANTIVGDKKTRGLSGGEKKRLALGCELIGSPSLIFADEPTTGLDSFQAGHSVHIHSMALTAHPFNIQLVSAAAEKAAVIMCANRLVMGMQAEKVMATLKGLADSGHTVVCTIHQPRGSIFHMFDDLMLLAGGQVIYHGPADQAVAAFKEMGLPAPVGENPAEYLIDQIAVDTSSLDSEAACKARIANLAAKQAEKTASALLASMSGGLSSGSLTSGSSSQRAHSPSSSVWSQFKMLFKRAWRQVTRDKATNIARFASSVGSAVIFGTIFFRIGYSQAAVQSRMGLMQVAAINCAMASLVKTLNLFPKERLIVQREQEKGSYLTTPYFLAKLAAELPVGSLFPLLFGSLMYPLTGLHPSWTRFARFAGILVVESFTSQALGLAVGAMAPSVDVAMALGPMVMVIFIVFGGYYVNEETIPRVLRWLPSCSLIKWAFQALTINDFRGLKFEAKAPTDAKDGEAVLARLGFADSSVLQALAGEARVLGFFYLATLLLLKRNKAKYAVVVEDD